MKIILTREVSPGLRKYGLTVGSVFTLKRKKLAANGRVTLKGVSLRRREYRVLPPD
jgi:hypothetical protein